MGTDSVSSQYIVQLIFVFQFEIVEVVKYGWLGAPGIVESKLGIPGAVVEVEVKGELDPFIASANN